MLKYFIRTVLINELRKQYRTLAKKFHPDLNPDNPTAEETMKVINSEYEQLLNEVNNAKDSHYKMKYEASWQDKFIETLKSFASINNVVVEMIGNWIWITGDTKPIKESIKKLGFKYSGKKVAWYWKQYTYIKQTAKKFAMQELRDIYGSREIEANIAKEENLIAQ